MTKIAKENLDWIYKILEERKKKGMEWWLKNIELRFYVIISNIKY